MANQENAGNPPREGKTLDPSGAAKSSMQSSKSSVQSSAESAADQARQYAQRAKRQANETAEQMKEKGEDIVHQVTTFASERPFATAAILFGLGGAAYALSSALAPRPRSSRWADTIRDQMHSGFQSAYDTGQRAYGSGTVSSLKRGLAQARKGMRDASSHIGEDLQHLLESGYEAGNRTVRDTVGRHPLATAAVVLGFGAAIASIVASTSSSKRKMQMPRRSPLHRREDMRYEELSSDELAEVAQERGIKDFASMSRSEIIHALRTL